MEESDGASAIVDFACAIFSGAALCGGPDAANLEAQCADAPVVLYQLEAADAADRAALERTLAVLERRLEGPALCALETWIDPDGTLVLRIASLGGDTLLDPTLLAPGRLDFYLVDDTRGTDAIAPGYAVLPDVSGNPIPVKWESLLPPEPVDSAAAAPNDWGDWVVNMRLTAEAGEAFADVTTAHVGKRLAIAVDDVIYTVPVVRAPIFGGSLAISGSFTPEEAVRLAAMLNGGTLPAGVALTLLSMQAEP